MPVDNWLLYILIGKWVLVMTGLIIFVLYDLVKDDGGKKK